MDLDVHDYNLTFLKRHSSAVDSWLEVPSVKRHTLNLLDRPVIVKDANWAKSKLHVDVVWVQRGLLLLTVVSHGEGLGALGDSEGSGRGSVFSLKDPVKESAGENFAQHLCLCGVTIKGAAVGYFVTVRDLFIIFYLI